MDRGRSEPADVCEQVLFGMVGEFMGLGESEVGRNCDVDFGAQGVSDPADAQLPDTLDALDGSDGPSCRVDESGVDGVHQPSAHLPYG